ncbi:MAG: NAD(P)H-dependent oxidoreductase subunit E [Bacteroidales bacterium]|nr:NAD(P)H-dependent oxidoreductase subunit E [Bacteroidales bacterium]MCF8343112.1 NAD(P)H-dependent oxidoreductase subunit E [Bacteroidales bacterium]MCF8349639.1 NAD(P)H-dependent oxidoreductase subunit E [Bacteroidales bacterium]MCF8376080.1 NAD(P)H-dependent oxidoreductase subunit E [Bacteroidales bacterium]MCF8400387.1 NAD(P)H-dependent oxidoreductase subunit E [Bacteroidales bacterium]
MGKSVKSICEEYNNDATRLMDILLEIQCKNGHIPDEAIEEVAKTLNISKVDVIQTLSFYHFFTRDNIGDYTVYLNNSAVADMMGRADVAEAFEKEAGCKFESLSEDGKIGLYSTSCIGMSDQEPAAIINGKVFTKLDPYKVKDLVLDMKAGKTIDEMVEKYGDGHNASDLVKSMVFNNIRKKGPVLFSDYETGTSLKKVTGMTPDEVVGIVKDSYLRGRGGAGFPVGLKWDFCRRTQSEETYLMCNADEGEPGTFKERVLLTEKPKLVFEGMAVAGYALDAKQGILYLRYEYKYLKNYLESVLNEMREANLLGKNILGKEGFDFDIRIQFGAGAYVCGEETALIESCEGKRGEPRNRPPFPVQKGYMDEPTVVNNVESLCSVVRIIEKGADWFTMMGSRESAGTKLLSISGDCKYQGVYEIEWGMRIRDIIEMVGAEDVKAIQVGGPSGTLISPRDFKRTICFEDLPTGGSMIIIGHNRNLLRDIVLNFTEFFIEESCGSCTVCRANTVILKDKLLKIMSGKAGKEEIDELKNWTKFNKMANRCGLGQTAANPILTSIENFREEYEKHVKMDEDFDTGFDLASAVEESCDYVGRKPNL